MPEWSFIWFILASILLIAEMLVMSVACFFFALGALAAALIACLDAGLSWQLGAFVTVSLLSLLGLRSRIKAWLGRADRQVRDNDLVGKVVYVLSPVSARQSGLVELNGARWQAELEPGSQPLSAGSQAVVTSFESLTLKVAAREQ